MEATKTCLNCRHRYGKDFDYAKCVRTGRYCEHEMFYGGRCAPRMGLWEPIPVASPNLFKRIWIKVTK